MWSFEAIVKRMVDPVTPLYYISIPAHDGMSGIPRGVSLAFAKWGGAAGAVSILNVL